MRTNVACKYRIARGSRIPQKSAHGIARELMIVSERSGGSLAAADVVDAAAKKKEFPSLHRQFEWDDVRAARLYRETQAREILRHITIEVERGDEVHEVRAFHCVELETEEGEEEHRRYVPLSRISKDSEMIDQVIETAKRDLGVWQSRYDRFRTTIPKFSQKFSPVFQALEKLSA